MKFTVRPNTTMFGKRKGFVASLQLQDDRVWDGPVSASRSEAKTACQQQVVDALTHITTAPEAPTVLRWRGHSAVVTANAHAWSYTVLWPDGHNSYTGGYESQAGALRSAAHHIAQAAWSVDVDDFTYTAEFLRTLARVAVKPPDVSLARDLVSYFAWQRNMRMLTDLGVRDHVARQMIDGFVDLPDGVVLQRATDVDDIMSFVREGA